MRQQVLDGDRPSPGYQAGKPPLDRILEPELPVLHEAQHEGCDEGLRDAADAKPFFGTWRSRAGDIREAADIDLPVPVPPNDEEDARRTRTLDTVEHRLELVPRLALEHAAG